MKLFRMPSRSLPDVRNDYGFNISDECIERIIRRAEWQHQHEIFLENVRTAHVWGFWILITAGVMLKLLR